MLDKTLTAFELAGLQSEANFADGHAYQDLSPSQDQIIAQLPQLWKLSSQRSIPEAEELYKNSFMELAQAHSLRNYSHYKISPTASNSIDLVGAWLAAKNLQVALLEPTFDNLYLLLKRRGVAVSPIAESHLHRNYDWNLALAAVDALFLVNPNNPSGGVLSEEVFCEIVNACVAGNKTILLDNTFRFFVPNYFDPYQILLASGVSFISIEDTGKVWPTQDMKASLIFFSADIAELFTELYEEIYLCVSNFSLAVLAEFLQDAHRNGLMTGLWAEVAMRRKLLRSALAASGGLLTPVESSRHTSLSVEWVQINHSRYSDVDLAHYLQSKNITVLPGRNFYWSQPNAHVKNLRFSLLKPRSKFLHSLKLLSEALSAYSSVAKSA